MHKAEQIGGAVCWLDVIAAEEEELIVGNHSVAF